MNFKKILAGVIALAMIATLTVNITAYDSGLSEDLEEAAVEPRAVEAADPDDFWWDELEDGTIIIHSYNGNDKEVVIPDEIDGKTVTKIDEHAFYNMDFITKVTIPESVNEIGGWAFERCTSLASVNIPDGVTEIADFTFNECYALAKVELPDSLTRIGEWAFGYCESLTAVTIPGSVKEIGGWAFFQCSSLTSVNIPEGVTEIGESTFFNCYDLAEIELPDSLTYIADWAFCYCESLKSIDLPNSVKEIGQEAFFGCSSLTSIVIPSSMTEIGVDLFGECTSLTDVVIPDSVTTIAPIAFANCESLAEIKIPDSVTSIGYYAFMGCALKKFTVPAGVTEIGFEAFRYCPALTGFDVSEGNKYFNTAEGVLFNKDFTEIVCYPKGKDGTTYTIPDTVTGIVDGAFVTSSLTEIVIPDSVTYIGEWAFDSCVSLTEIKIPAGVTEIGTEAFFFCTALTGFDVSGDNKYFDTIDGVLFSKDFTEIVCYPIGKGGTSYIIPDTVTKIRDCAFGYCSSLTEIVIPDSVTEIERCAFEGCSALTKVTIPAGVTEIGEQVFLKCPVVIYGYAGSKAEEYAKEYGIKFVDEKGTIKNTYTFTEDDRLVLPFNLHEQLDISEMKETDVISVKMELIDSESEIINIGFAPVIDGEIGEYYSGWGSSEPSAAIDVSVTLADIFTDLECYYNTDEIKDLVIIVYGVEADDTVYYEISVTKGNDEEEPEETTATAPSVPSQPAVTTAATEATTTEAAATTTTTTTTPAASTTTAATTVTERVVDVDENTGVQLLAAEGVLEEGVEMKVVIGDADVGTNAKIYVIDITLVNMAGENVQPNGSVTVKIPLPETFDTNKTYYVYYQAEDGTLTDMHASFADGYVSFTTNHFSRYILSDEKLVEDDVTNTNRNPHTGAVILIIPALAAAAGVVISKKRK